jgi:hypothetical protein
LTLADDEHLLGVAFAYWELKVTDVLPGDLDVACRDAFADVER